MIDLWGFLLCELILWSHPIIDRKFAPTPIISSLTIWHHGAFFRSPYGIWVVAVLINADCGSAAAVRSNGWMLTHPSAALVDSRWCQTFWRLAKRYFLHFLSMSLDHREETAAVHDRLVCTKCVYLSRCACMFVCLFTWPLSLLAHHCESNHHVCVYVHIGNDVGRCSYCVLQVKQAFEYAFVVLASAVLPQYSLHRARSDVSILGRIIKISKVISISSVCYWVGQTLGGSDSQNTQSFAYKCNKRLD